MGENHHIPIMVDEVIRSLQVSPGHRYCDATIGWGGHAFHILQNSSPDGELIGLDRDPEAVEYCRERFHSFGQRVTVCHGNFDTVVNTLSHLGLVPVDGFLLDLGVSSFQLDTPRRGFSISAQGPLDMRMDPSQGATAAELIAKSSEQDLAKIIRQYGEEPFSKRIARVIKQAWNRGEIVDTTSLAKIVSAAVNRRDSDFRRKKIHPATRTFMALRIAINDELGALQHFLSTFTEALKPGGRVAVITFHSLEDRMVKEHFARLANPCTCPPGLPVCICAKKPELKIITRKAIRPTTDETIQNPRARSAKLRVAERI